MNDELNHRAPAQPEPAAPPLCMCKDRPLADCPGEWEPGCDLGNNPAYVKVAPAALSEAVNRALLETEAAPTVVEPVAWRHKELVNNDFVTDWILTKAEPADGIRVVAKQPLYATPPRAALTREQISELAVQEQLLLICDNLDALVEIVAVVEQAHGIGGPRNE